jgi:NAD(P)-dependent dehydrogenase (short-subunit alcohol dehydrogenase family)
MDLGLAGRAALVTGGSTGVGRAAAIALAAEGARVAISYASNEAAAHHTEDLIRQSGGEVQSVLMRLEDPASIEQAVRTVTGTWGGIDVLIANAVRWEEQQPDGSRRFEEVPAEEWRSFLRANIEGTLEVVRSVLPSMRSRSAGRIVFVSSGVAEEGMPGGALVYATAKAALHGFARSLAWDLGPTGILVNVLALGMTMTDHSLTTFPEPIRETMASLTPTGALSTPEQVAQWLVFLSSTANQTITGELFREGSSTARSPHGALRH